MAATINTNLASINAQRHLSNSGATLGVTMQRLSSGLRVNSAKDDAAGLAIGERMQTQLKGMQVAVRNVNDGVSLAQTAEGALAKAGDMLQRMRELAVQAANVSNSSSDRAALQKEVSQLVAEVDRIAKQSSFNGRKLLDGSLAGAVFQAGANSGDNITLDSLVNMRSEQLSVIAYAKDTLTFDASDTPIAAIAQHAQPIAAGTLKIQIGNDQEIKLGRIEAAGSSSERLGQVLAAINAQSAETGVTAYTELTTPPSGYTIELMGGRLDSNQIPLDVRFTGFSFDTTGIRGNWEKTPDSYMKAWGAIANATPFEPDEFEVLMQKVEHNNPSMPDEGGVQSYWQAYIHSPTQANAKTLVDKVEFGNNATHYPVIVKARDNFLYADPKTDALAAAYASQLNTHFGAGITAPTGADSNAWTDQEVYAAVALFGQAEAKVNYPAELNLNVFNHKLEQHGLDDMDVSTQGGAWVALKKIDSAIDQVNAARADLGALQTRFESAANNLDVQVENLAAARGRIVDADFAMETANLSRAQILQQAGTAMVAQANQLTQNVMQLLGR